MKNKAIKVILSCKSISQLTSASKYTKLYYVKSKDYIGYNELIKLIREKTKNVNTLTK
jgi:hypothetical protein